MDFVRDACRDKILDSVLSEGNADHAGTGRDETAPEKVRDTFDFSQVKEFTVEAGRADSITRDKLRVMMRSTA